MKQLIAAAILLSACAHAPPVEAPETGPTAPPEWYTENVEYMTRGSGTWITSNADFVSEQEAWTEYGTRWSAGPGNYSMSGELFGRDGTGREAVFWLFSEHWDPALGEAVVEQYGWGAVGKGTMVLDANGDTLMDQVFTQYQDGTARREGHRTVRDGDDAYTTHSYSIEEDGTQTPRRTYIWKRETQE